MIPIRPRHYLTAIAALLLCGVGAGCGSSGGSSTPAKATNASDSTSATKLSQVTLRIGDQAGTGAEARLQAAGLLGKLPFKVSWSDFTSGPPMLQALGAGALDIGGVGDAPPVFAASGGAKIDIVGALSTNPNDAALVVPKGSPIHSISQLRGKKIAVAQGSSADYHLLTVLSRAGLTVHDVSLVYLQPAEGLAALTSGSVAAWDIWGPFIQQAQAQKGARVLVNGDGYGANFSYEVASRAAIGNSTTAEAIRDYLKLLDQAYTWTDTHPQAWASAWSKATGLSTSITLQAAKDDTTTPVPIDATTVGSEQGLVNAFSAAGLIPSKYSFSNYAYSGFNTVLQP
jgi:sulfonate transport system substrate-binding protein